jgi:hypothetical protein
MHTPIKSTDGFHAIRWVDVRCTMVGPSHEAGWTPVARGRERARWGGVSRNGLAHNLPVEVVERVGDIERDDPFPVSCRITNAPVHTAGALFGEGHLSIGLRERANPAGLSPGGELPAHTP